MALKAWPSTPDPWVTDYVVWRIASGKAADRPKSVPAAIPAYANEVLYWVIWRRKGRPDPRPNVCKVIPAWGYATLDATNRRTPIQIPSVLHDYIQTWVIWRFRGEPDPKPPNIPREISVAAPYCWSVLNFCAWQRRRFSNPAEPRPLNIPAYIPPSTWDLLKILNRMVPLGPPPPPPPPPDDPKPPSTWTLPNPIVFTAQGWFDDSDFRDTDAALLRMVNAGVRTVFLQIGNYGPDVPGRCRAHGLRVVLWTGNALPSDAEALALAEADGYCPQIEGPEQYQNALANFKNGVGAGMARSVVTTLYGFNTFTRRAPTQHYPDGQLTTVEYEAMRPYCTHAWVECYVQDGGAHYPISKMQFGASQRGIDYMNPLLGLWADAAVGVYQPDLAGFGKQVGGYLAETMTPQNWIDFGALGT